MKGFGILCVVIGHFIEYHRGTAPGINALFTCIYLFHMAIFCTASGLVAKFSLRKLVTQQLWLYLISQAGITAFRAAALKDNIVDQGGEQIGIHPYDRVKLTGLNKTDFDAQVDRTRSILKGVLGHNDFLLRPPYGMTDNGVKTWAGCPIILWSIDPEDWKDQNTPREVRQIVSEARDGDIILMHDIFSASVDAALQVIDQLHARGFLFCTIDELYAARHIDLEPGEVYWNAYP